MKNKSFAALGLLTLLASASAFGQQRFDVPFEFHVGKSVMPAGHYDVDQASTGSVMLSFGCQESRAKVFALTNGASGYHQGRQAHGRLVFHKYGGTYFLSEVWSSGNGTGRALIQSKTERELIRTASLARTDEIVLARR